MAKKNGHLYLKLSDTLAEQIMDGTLPEGSLLPSERDLCQQHGISRTTVRQALQDLSQKGYIRTIHGKGTMVVRPQIRQELIPQNGVLKLRPRNGEAIHGKAVSGSAQETVSADGELEGGIHSSFGRDGSLVNWGNPADSIVWGVTLPAGRYQILLETRNLASWDAHAEWFGGRKVAWTMGDFSGEVELTRISGTGASGESLIGECEFAGDFTGELVLRTSAILSEDAANMNLTGLCFVKC